MRLRTRLIGAVTLAAAVTLGGAFAVIAAAVNGSQERQLDAALRAEAAEEAQEAAALGGDELAISDRPGPAANDVGPLTKYAVLYGRDGGVLARTPTFRQAPPALSSLRRREGACFDLWFQGEHLRAVLVPVPRHAALLLLAAPRADLDGDAAFLARAMLLVWAVAVAWTALNTQWVMRRLTRGHQAVTAVARRVAAGDLDARVGRVATDRETAQLAEDIDGMIGRLDTLLRAQRRFIAHAAHELRSPLTTLYGELQHALRRPRDGEAYRLAIEEALDATRRLKLLTEDLLTLARLEGTRELPGEPLSASEVVGDAVRSLEAEARARGVRVEVGGQGPVVRGRRADLERMLRNLLENAVRHSPQGGRVAVALAPAPGGLAITLSDEGPGIAPDERERIFEPFYRGPRERAQDLPGAGLGLAIAREIARAHGGDLTLGDAERGGAVFQVRLPASS